MTLLEHLTELRKRLMWSILAVSVCAVAGWFGFDRVVAWVMQPARPFLSSDKFIFLGPMDAFTLRLKVSGYVGFALAFPVVLYQFWRFVAPGLKSGEKKYAIPFVLCGMVLFVVGVGFAYNTLSQALRFLIGPSIAGTFIEPMLTAKQYVGFILLYLLAFGLCFEFPVVLMFLTLARVLTSAQMAKYRRHVFVGIAVVVAVATPSVDLYTMIVLTVAMYVLFESCIWLSRLLKR